MLLGAVRAVTVTVHQPGRVEGWRGTHKWARFQPPPPQTQHADFPHYAYLHTSPQVYGTYRAGDAFIGG